MHVLIADSLSSVCASHLETLGCQITSAPSLSGESLEAALARERPDVLVVRSTRVNEQALDAADGLMLVVRAGAGTNTIDVGGASRRAIFVANCPGKNAVAVAELAFGLILSADRAIPDAAADLRRGRWDKKRYASAQGLAGRTLGLVGLGQIGMEMVPRARAFGMEVVAWSRSLTDAKAAALKIERAETPLELAARADVVSVHVALNDQTREMIDRDFLTALRPGAILVNTSRGEVVDEAALLDALEHQDLRCGLDVFAAEPSSSPAEVDSPLMRHPKVSGTHHIGASTQQAQDAVAAEVARIIESFKCRGVVPNCVNLSTTSAATHVLIVRHRDEVGVLAAVLDALKGAGLNVQEMENVIFEGALAAVAKIRLESEPDAPLVDHIRAMEHVFSARSVRL